jgi:hypothetical protein
MSPLRVLVAILLAPAPGTDPAAAAAAEPVVALELSGTPPDRGFAFGWSGEPRVSAGTFAAGWSLAGVIVPGSSGRGSALNLAGGPRLEYESGTRTRLWAGLALEHRAVAGARSTTPILEAGVRSERGPLRARAGVAHLRRHRDAAPVLIWSWTAPDGFQSPPDTFPTVPYWEFSAPVPVGVTALAFGAEWDARRWTVATSGGVTIGRGFAPIPAGTLRATHWIRPDLGLVLGVRSAVPSWLAADADPHRRLELGLRVVPGRGSRRVVAAAAVENAESPGWEVVARGGLFALRVRMPGPRLFLRGDFTDWEPIELARASDGWWELERALGPGVHEVEVSTDGRRWSPPPGTLVSASAYGSSVGRFVVD